jgi:hypothetical protein
MNRIQDALDEVFSNYERTAEMDELYQSILSDCEERYEDNLKQGMSEEEAYDSVIDSLGDLDELLAQMNREKGKEDDLSDAAEADGVISAIVIETGSRDVYLTGIEEDEVFVDANPDMHQTVRGHTLYLDENTNGNLAVGLIFSMREKVVQISVPAGVDRISVVTSSGSVSLAEISSRSVSIKSTSGDIGIRSFGGEQLDISTTSGDADVDLYGSGIRMTVNTTSGDCDVGGRGLQTLDMKMISGDLTVSMPDPFERIRVSSTSGDVELNDSGIDHVDLSFKTISGELNCQKDRMQGENRMEIRTISGDLTIQ